MNQAARQEALAYIQQAGEWLKLLPGLSPESQADQLDACRRAWVMVKRAPNEKRARLALDIALLVVAKEEACSLLRRAQRALLNADLF